MLNPQLKARRLCVFLPLQQCLAAPASDFLSPAVCVQYG